MTFCRCSVAKLTFHFGEQRHGLWRASDDPDRTTTPLDGHLLARLEGGDVHLDGSPGGFGTLEELVEVLVLRQLHYHDKPIVALNVHGVYDELFAFFRRLEADRFIKASHFELFHIADNAAAALAHIEGYVPAPREEKWFPIRAGE